MSTLKTQPTDINAIDFILSVKDETMRHDCMKLLSIFGEITGEHPVMWGSAIVGFGKYHYKSERSRQEGDWPLTGFSPRKQAITIYIIPGFEKHKLLLDKLGKHKTSVSCLYIKRLSDIDMSVLRKIITNSFADAKSQFIK